MIENTTRRVQENPSAFLDASSGPGGSDQAIEEQERAGQTQLVNSDRLPTDRQGSPAEYEALGFVFGDPDPDDPLFAPATLPEGWTRQASDHDMWSYLVDGLGRRRAFIFYKAAFYNRHAFMSLASVDSYLYEHRHEGVELVTDESWATPAAIRRACTRAMERAQEEIDRWAGRNLGEDIVARHRDDRDWYAGILAKHE
ncbi:hypothetical protein ACWD7M_17025 [Streptomyces griseus]